MATMEPIRELRQIEALKTYFLNVHSAPHVDERRNYFLFEFGINTGLRISDILKLKVGDVYHRTHMQLVEKKTRKFKLFRINPALQLEVERFCEGKQLEAFLFESAPGVQLSRFQAWRIIHDGLEWAGVEPAGCHSLRKTFGYHFYQRTKDVALLQMIFNHSSPAVTLRYIGIHQDMMDQSLQAFNL